MFFRPGMGLQQYVLQIAFHALEYPKTAIEALFLRLNLINSIFKEPRAGNTMMLSSEK